MTTKKRYESMLFAEDLESERGLTCLACHAEVGRISWLGGALRDRRPDEPLRLVALAVDRRRVQGVIGTREYVRFSCDCGKTSVYHLCL
ncbi:MAG TPA: hypothetical protein PKE00_17315 [Planctomycetota bacterium]|nr:hypothetical protein [Planctomycetota bacterium]